MSLRGACWLVMLPKCIRTPLASLGRAFTYPAKPSGRGVGVHDSLPTANPKHHISAISDRFNFADRMGAANLPTAGFSFFDQISVAATTGESVSPFSGNFLLPLNVVTAAGMSNHITDTPYEQ
ncbi:unnamed protein product [Citrullus colocynthis]|uniref:Uncharacterized protein n=1 Tax=Citrullus colocynthis TaxID=252529 RepID=A0ABP0XML8_9ROSI